MSGADNFERIYLMDRWPSKLVEAVSEVYSDVIIGFHIHCDGCGARTGKRETLDDARKSASEAGWAHVVEQDTKRESDFCPACIEAVSA